MDYNHINHKKCPLTGITLIDWQNYLRTQAGNTTTVNVINCTVDYLLRLQESIMDFYWHYSSKEIIDPAGKLNFFKAIGVASQVSCAKFCCSWR